MIHTVYIITWSQNYLSRREMRSTNNAKKMKKWQGKNRESEDMLIGLIFPISSLSFFICYKKILLLALMVHTPFGNYIFFTCLPLFLFKRRLCISPLLNTWEDHLEVVVETHLVLYHCPPQMPSSIPMLYEFPNGNA